LIFGSHDKGLLDIAQDEGFNLKKYVNTILNFIPQQGTYTVRTEEAIPISLAIINILIS